MLVCEGESDVQTLFASGIPAIGISGKKGWDPKFADLPQIKCVKEVVIVQEPNAEDFVEAVAPSFDDKKVWVVKLPAKDPSELWLQVKPKEVPPDAQMEACLKASGLRQVPKADPTGARIEAFLEEWNKAIDAAQL